MLSPITFMSRLRLLPVILLYTLIWYSGSERVAQAQSPCDAPVLNPVVCENSKPGNPPSEWDISGAGDADIQGFTTDISVNQGETVHFKIDTDSTDYRLDIYRMGYYNGDGARKVATITPSVTLPQNQPSCLSDPTTGLVDCGNWAESAAWSVPADATSGIYFAKLVRADSASEGSHIVFVVRDDDGGSDILFQTSDTTWQAYNSYGGNSLYIGAPVGRAYKVSYNRPFNTRDATAEDWVFNAEYPMVRWLEANGYNVSYFTGVDSDRRGAEILEHKVFLSVGHDEYWSAAQRSHVETARAAGIHLAFFSGNEVFWKTRWENSIDGSGTPYRTLVSYKETHANAKIDPLPGVWTGTWRDPRFSPPADGNQPENALTGTIFTVNCCDFAGIEVSPAEGKMRLWRHTSLANLAPGTTATLANGVIGYEWDEDVDNGSRPPGLVRLSSTTVNVSGHLIDFGSTYAPGVATHHLTLYRHSSGALVFGAGTVQWPWGLDDNHDNPFGVPLSAPDTRMQQATINLFADMSVQPDTLQAGLVAATASTDTSAPISTITFPESGATVFVNNPITVTGTAADTGGGVIGGIEISVDGGTTWHPASGRENWNYTWTPETLGVVTLMSRAVDDSGYIESPVNSITVSTELSLPECPCSLWGDATTPTVTADPDNAPIEVGMKFQATVDGFITALRFYKDVTNTGPHVGHLWTNGGTLLAAVPFINETPSGWQEAALSSPVPITANTTYVVSYHTTTGHYAIDAAYFGAGVDVPPLRALADTIAGGNGVYRYGASSFPTQTFQASNYWVDIVFHTVVPPDTTPPTISVTSFPEGATDVDVGANPTVTFDESMDAATITTTTVQLLDSLGAPVAVTVTYDIATRTVILAPVNPLFPFTTYTVLLKGGSSGVKDLAGNPLSEDVSFSFTTGAPPECPCSLWDDVTVPTVSADPDTTPIEVGMKFQATVDGFITALRFYKGVTNTGSHIGHLWTSGGVLLASVAFTNETPSGWQETTLSPPVPITANTTYVVSYHTTTGRYAIDEAYFTTEVVKTPLRALANGVSGGNGVYQYGAGNFPTQTFNASNYWVDIVFHTVVPPDTTPPTVTVKAPADGAVNVDIGTVVTATFNEPINPTTLTTGSFELRDAANTLVSATVSYNDVTRQATLTPGGLLELLTTYTVTMKGGGNGIQDIAGNSLIADITWSFTTEGPPPDEGPGGPILVISSTTNPFSRYYAEILRTEGFNAFIVSDISFVSAATLSAYDVVILDAIPLSSTQVTMLSDWVSAGGNLIAMRPDKQLAGLFGLSDASSTLPDAYLLVNTATGPGVGIVNSTIQFHGTADLYTLNGATSLATLYADANTATPYPAVTLHNVGTNGGQAAAFTYNLAQSIVDMRQGNPAWREQERDGFSPIRSDDMFFGNAAHDPQPDWIDLNKVDIPQADEQQRLLANLILQVNLDKKPLPRFWYFPRGLPAVVILTGDDHANGATVGRFEQHLASSPAGCSVEDWECIRSTSYIYYNTPITDTQAAAYTSVGFEVALHINTGCTNSTPAELEAFYSNQLNLFATNYPSLPTPSTHRTHCIAWSDYVTQAHVELAHGIRLDTTYYYWPPSWVLDRPGFFTGSGMPMRFVDLDGTVIDVYQAATQMTDESGQTYPFTIDTLLDKALGAEGYYGAFVVNAHTDVVASIESDAVVTSALARGIPVISARQMLVWLDGRNNSSFGSLTWNTNALNFSIDTAPGARGLEAMLPVNSVVGGLVSITLNGNAIAYTTKLIKGLDYAIFPAVSGIYQATYGAGPGPDTTPPTVNITFPSDGATGVATNAVVTAVFSEAIDAATVTTNNFTLHNATNALVTANVNYNPGTRTATLSPAVPLASGTLYTARLIGGTSGVKDVAGNALVADVSWSFTTVAAPPAPQCPCRVWADTTLPAIADAQDTAAVELGMKFQSTVDGFITGLRFYKSAANTGPHLGNLWTSTGTLLASVTYSNESASGWQEVTLPTAVAVTANTTYVVSYHTSVGHYAFSPAYFTSTGVEQPPLRALADGVAGGNGVFQYGASSFPTQTYQAGNYWVDVVFDTVAPPADTTPPTVSAMTPSNGATDVPLAAGITVTFDEAMAAGSLTPTALVLRDATATIVAATVSYEGTTRTATLTPTADLAVATTYTVTVSGGPTGVTDLAGNALAGDVTWSFTTVAAPPAPQCPCRVWADTTLPAIADAQDTAAVELGMKFQSTVDGFITGLRFYKSAANTGPHLGNLWTSTGTLLASVTYSNESASGWQEVTLPTAVAVTANTTYVVSYHTSVGHYAFSPAYFTSTGVEQPPLRALASGVAGGNGVFQYGASGFPTQTYQAGNYWVDVVFNTVALP